MIRKQLYIDDRQERALKRKAKELAVSEAEFVRRALDRVLDDATRTPPRSLEALEAFLNRAKAVAARGHYLPGRLRRDQLYEEREARLVRR